MSGEGITSLARLIDSHLLPLHGRNVFEQWIAEDEFDGWDNHQIHLFMTVIMGNITEKSFALTSVGDRVSSCFHVSAKKGFMEISSPIYEADTTTLTIIRFVDVQRNFSYDRYSGIHLSGPSFGFIKPYIQANNESLRLSSTPKGLSDTGETIEYTRQRDRIHIPHYQYASAGLD